MGLAVDDWKERFREAYPHKSARELSEEFGISERSVYRWASKMGLHKNAGYLSRMRRKGLLEIEYRRLCGQRMGGVPKGVRTNPDGEFKKGHRFAGAQEAKRVKAIRDRAWDERVRIIRGWRRKTRWKMREFGNENGNS